METQPSASKTGTYVYCVLPGTAKKASFRTPPIGANGAKRKPRLVRDGDLAALVSDVPLTEYDPSRANLAAHEGLLDEALENSDVLPMRFGTVAGNDSEVVGFLRSKHDALVRFLEGVKGKAELNVKVMWDRNRIFAEILVEEPKLKGLLGASGGAARAPDDNTLELGRAVFEAMERKREAEAKRIVDQLRGFATDVSVNRLLSEDMILNASFLVERSKIPLFDEQVRALSAAETNRLVFKYVGPLPPYSFVNLVIQAQPA
ncbi:MAG: GvpL/GvpF family gas vesicle protein [Polyangiaceae bacterium]|nr:GvpL/GvpF family gas vesicle protein [Polyangiaceae bacterium]